ncbi:MAG: hypothetical protein ABI663_15550 [Chryseolinea sp.]
MDHNIEIPVSFFSVGGLPKNSFNVNSYTIGNPWEDIAVNSITNTFLDLYQKKIIDFKLIKPEKRILFNLIIWRFSEYEITSKYDNEDEVVLPWLESKILDSIIRSPQKAYLKSSIKHLINSILIQDGGFTNPSKQILAQLIINSKTTLWTFETKEHGFFISKERQLSKIKVNLSSQNKEIINTAKLKFDILFNNSDMSKNILDWNNTVSNLTRKIISSRVDLD